MIYSDEINKTCYLCSHAQIAEGDVVFCNLKKKNIAKPQDGCKLFDYDIFKKTVRRKKQFKTDFSPEDFTL